MAQRQGFRPWRRVPVGSVLTRLGLPSTALARGGAAARRMTGRLDIGRVIRGALLTPWSMVGLGFVVAASLTLATPRAVLTFPPSQAARCAAKYCQPNGTGPQDSPVPAAKRGVTFPSIHTGAAGRSPGGLAAHGARRASPPVSVQYALLPRDNDHFIAVIVITGQRALGDWTLRFRIPGAQIKLVMWARWTPVGLDGGIVSGSPWPSDPAAETRARVVIMGTGAPGRPRGCVFDGVRCSFRDFRGGVNHFTWRPGQEGGG
jgi:hypothetical protein